MVSKRLRSKVLVITILVAGLVNYSEARAEVWTSNEVIGYLVNGVGYGHGRGMSQFGAYGWAVDHDWDWREILDFYYGGTILADATESNIRVRLTGWDDTTDLIGVSLNGVISAASGGEIVATGSAIRLRRTGTNTFTIQSAPEPTCGTSSNYPFPLGPFSQTSERQTSVKVIQSFLLNRGFKPGPVDGIYGPMTAEAVKRFGTTVGLSNDGRWTAEEAYIASLQTLQIPREQLQVDSSDYLGVKELQRFLNEHGYSAGPVDGIFGSMTRSALLRFEEAKSLPVDGVWDRIDAEAAIGQKWSGTSASGDWSDVLTTVSGPITLSVDKDEASGNGANGIGVCTGSQVTHYRGTIELLESSGRTRVINEISTENYLRGVVPKEVSASWGDAGNGKGMNALRAQAVAARSYALAQNRWSYADTCDTQSCQVYGGAGTRTSIDGSFLAVERQQTDTAILDTTGKVRTWAAGSRAGQIASTEFSSSNGPRTAGGAFPSVEDLGDSTSINPNHTWTRVITLDELSSKYPSADPNAVATETDPNSAYQGVYANRVRLNSNSSVSANSFSDTFGLLSSGFTLEKITAPMRSDLSMVQIGDSVGVGANSRGLGGAFTELSQHLFDETLHNNVESRPLGSTVGSNNGLEVLKGISDETDVVVVELGYNGGLTAESIDKAMEIVEGNGSPLVVWISLSERSANYRSSNANLSDAQSRWPNLRVVDWANFSSGSSSDRWFRSDGLHLTVTGNAEFSVWLTAELAGLLQFFESSPEATDECAAANECSPQTAIVTVDVPNGPIVFKSVDSSSVRKIQQFLSQYGFAPGPVDGDFGRMTLAGLNRFQQQNGLSVTDRWAPADAAKAREIGTITPETAPQASSILPVGPLSIGNADSSSTTQVQRYLRFAGHNPGPVDGIYGGMTAGAVTRFQAAKGLPQSGNWGSAEHIAAS